MKGDFDEVLPIIYNGFLGNVGRDPNIAHELYKRGRVKKPVGLQATSHRIAWEDSWYSFKTSQISQEEGLKKLPLITHRQPPRSAQNLLRKSGASAIPVLARRIW